MEKEGNCSRHQHIPAPDSSRKVLEWFPPSGSSMCKTAELGTEQLYRVNQQHLWKVSLWQAQGPLFTATCRSSPSSPSESPGGGFGSLLKGRYPAQAGRPAASAARSHFQHPRAVGQTRSQTAGFSPPIQTNFLSLEKRPSSSYLQDPFPAFPSCLGGL